MDPFSTAIIHDYVKVLLQDALDGLRHVLHDVVGLHQRRVEPEVPVPVEHRLFDAVAGVGRHLRTPVQTRTDLQDVAEGSASSLSHRLTLPPPAAAAASDPAAAPM
ncbi:hypothetical protein EYF80_039973 [Liparis tanakae]|uniref:Uncharacterized protein n=1 Tax=Liparis tanakae TaxID=230148 RepID=A0A4Z2G8H2_9TELE|nr:hypothetical protein EYF80_039973 [Liparis tanakae]